MSYDNEQQTLLVLWEASEKEDFSHTVDHNVSDDDALSTEQPWHGHQQSDDVIFQLERRKKETQNKSYYTGKDGVTKWLAKI